MAMEIGQLIGSFGTLGPEQGGPGGRSWLMGIGHDGACWRWVGVNEARPLQPGGGRLAPGWSPAAPGDARLWLVVEDPQPPPALARR